MTSSVTPTAQTRAEVAVKELAGRLDEAEDLLRGFLDRFYWVQDHEGFFADVKKFLAKP